MATTTHEKSCYTAKDVAEQMQLSLPVVYEIINREGFPKIRVGRCIRIPREAFEAWLLREMTKCL